MSNFSGMVTQFHQPTTQARAGRSRRATLRPVAGLPVSVEPPVGRDLGYIRNDRPRVHAEFQNASRVNRLDLPGVRRRFHDAPRN